MTLGRRRLYLLAVTVAVVGHQVALAVGDLPRIVGFGSLQATEHGAGWFLTVLAIVVGALATLALAAWRIRSLRRQLVAVSARVPWSAPPSRADLLAASLRIFALAILAFLLQENYEHLSAHGHLPLLEPLLAGQYVATMPVFAALAVLAATLGLRLGMRIAELEAALATSARAPSRAPLRLRMPDHRLDDLRDTARRASGRFGRRAPPHPVLV
jgi:hypothetical protein